MSQMLECEQPLGLRIGLEPITNINLIENHDEAYTVWRDAAVKQQTLVHIDAHHDLYGRWIKPEDKHITIANYIFAALESGMVDQVYWVVPSGSWATAKHRKDVYRAVKKIVSKNSKPAAQIHVTPHAIRTIVFGKPLHVCILDNLPVLDETVLLDVDVDYMMIPNSGYRGIEYYGELPWCWPADLVAQLQAKRVRTDMITIAYSVEGGYTPLQWKYLGDELAARLRQPKQAEDVVVCASNLMREAVLMASQEDHVAAEETYRQASQLQPEAAAPWLHLSHLCASTGHVDEAQEHYQRALSLDPTYHTAFNSAGFWYYSVDRFDSANKAHHRILHLDPTDANAHLGLGMSAIEKKEWLPAEESLRSAISRDDKNIDAYRLLGLVLTKTSRYEEAIPPYEQALKLALSGSQSILDGRITTSSQPTFRSDPWHAIIHERLARLHMRQGADEKAINGYRMGIAFGGDGVQIRRHLALLYLKQQDWRRSAQEGWQAIRMMPKATWEMVLHGYYRLKWKFHKWMRILRNWRRSSPPSLWH